MKILFLLLNIMHLTLTLNWHFYNKLHLLHVSLHLRSDVSLQPTGSLNCVVSFKLQLEIWKVYSQQCILVLVTHPHMSHLYSRMPRCLFTWFLASPSWAVAKLQILHIKGLDPVKQMTERKKWQIRKNTSVGMLCDHKK